MQTWELTPCTIVPFKECQFYEFLKMWIVLCCVMEVRTNVDLPINPLILKKSCSDWPTSYALGHIHIGLILFHNIKHPHCGSQLGQHCCLSLKGFWPVLFFSKKINGIKSVGVLINLYTLKEKMLYFLFQSMMKPIVE